MQYQPPVNDIKFVLFDVLGVDQLQTLEKYAEATPDIICAVIEEAGKLDCPPFEVTRLVLFSSQTRAEGAVYTPERYYIF